MTRRNVLALFVPQEPSVCGRDLRERYTQFCAAYDAVGDTANVFARAYNLGKGTVWPLRESRQFELAQANYERAFHHLYSSDAWVSTRK